MSNDIDSSLRDRDLIIRFEKYLREYLSSFSLEQQIKFLRSAISQNDLNCLFEITKLKDGSIVYLTSEALIHREALIHLAEEVNKKHSFLKADAILKRTFFEKESQERKRTQVRKATAKLSNPKAMSTTVTYNKEKDFDKADDRPYAEVVIYGNNGTSKRLFCLVDTGADDIQIHEDFAADLDIDLTTEGTPDDIETASGGKVQVYILNNVKMKVEGKIIHEDLIFGNNDTPLIGRRTILTAYDIGFETKRWLF